MKAKDLEIGKVYYNQSKKYLAEILARSLPKEFVKTYLSHEIHTTICGWFMDDIQFRHATGIEHKYLLFCVIDINGKFLPAKHRYLSVERGKENFFSFLSFFRKSRYAFYDYHLDDLRFPRRHVLVFDLSNWKLAHSKFRKGEYSKMFSKDDLNKLKLSSRTKNEGARNLYYVLTRDDKVRTLFEEKIRKKFNMPYYTVPKDYSGEYDISPIPKEEILNYEKEKEEKEPQ